MTLKEMFEKYENAEDYIIDMLSENISEDLVSKIEAEIMENNFSIEEVEKAVAGMKNVDGTEGEHWTIDQTNEVYDNEKLEYNRCDWYYVLNMMRSDYFKLFGNDTNTYIKLAEAWLDDSDVSPFKAKRYYDYIVLGK